MAFTEFYTNASTGSNMNGGSDENASPSYTATNGGWNSGTGVFTPTSGDPSASVTVGQFAHVFADGSTTPTFIGRVTAVNSTTITVSTTAKSGTAPGTSATGISINVGGVWKGPNAAVGFPFGFVSGSVMTNAAGNYARVNLKNNATYNVTATVAASVNGPVWWQGYTTTPGDGGKFTLDGGSNAIVILSGVGVRQWLVDAIISNNGSSGNNDGCSWTGNANQAIRVVVHDVRGYGLVVGTGFAVECETYACNGSNTANQAGMFLSGNGYRCTSHDNVGSNSSGIRHAGGFLIGCIADTNGAVGINNLVSGAQCNIINCDAYNNGSTGISIGGANSHVSIENCNLVKNGGYGIGAANSGTNSILVNNAFGSGTQANTSGTVQVNNSIESGTVTYAADVTPWVDPANGDFRINLATAKGTGRGTFTQTASGYAGTVGYPDIGAAQHADAGSTVQIVVASYRKVR